MADMMDRRLFAANARVAHVSLSDDPEVTRQRNIRFVDGHRASVVAPVVDLLRSPGGARDRQLLAGAGFLILEADSGGGMAFGRCEADGYVGYVARAGLGTFRAPTHRVTSLGAHVYAKPEIRAEPVTALPFRAGVVVREGSEANSRDWFRELVTGGFMAASQLEPVAVQAADPVVTAERLEGAPYLWGGDSNWGLDCSALVQMSLEAAGIVAPRDSDMQAGAVGTPLDSNAPLGRGDLVFWNGHVGIMADGLCLIHANAFHMAVTIEPLDEVVSRIRSAGEGDVTVKRRP